jgi:hypothetical protein
MPSPIPNMPQGSSSSSGGGGSSKSAYLPSRVARARLSRALANPPYLVHSRTRRFRHHFPHLCFDTKATFAQVPRAPPRFVALIGSPALWQVVTHFSQPQTLGRFLCPAPYRPYPSPSLPAGCHSSSGYAANMWLPPDSSHPQTDSTRTRWACCSCRYGQE